MDIPTDPTAFETLARTIQPRSYFRWDRNELEEKPICDDIELDHPRHRSNDHIYLTRISGEPGKVLAEVHHRLRADPGHYMYEHMRTRVATVEIEDENFIRVVLSKNNYAGD